MDDERRDDRKGGRMDGRRIDEEVVEGWMEDE